MNRIDPKNMRGIISAHTDEYDDLFRFADDAPAFMDDEDDELIQATNSGTPWNILIVDDEPSVISVTELALRRFTVDNRPMRVLSAESAKNAQAILAAEDDMAVIVTDVVMETENAGLDLTRWVRQQSQFDATRLVIRTGQPGMAPEEEILTHLEINDYWPKTEVTAHRMRTILTGLIRSFRDIRTVEHQNQQLREMQRLLFEQERLKVLGELVSGIAHDFNNALTPITAFASILLDDDEVEEDERIEFLNIILTAGKDAAALIKRLRSYYLPGGDTIRYEIDVARLLSDTVALAYPKKEKREMNEGINISIKSNTADGIILNCHEPEMRQSLLNLVINAIDVVGDGGTIALTARENETSIIIEVIDNGKGMSPDVLSQCREAFFSTKGDQGTGLGLAMVSRTVEEHGGQMDIESKLDEGTTIRLSIPKGGDESTSLPN